MIHNTIDEILFIVFISILIIFLLYACITLRNRLRELGEIIAAQSERPHEGEDPR